MHPPLWLRLQVLACCAGAVGPRHLDLAPATVRFFSCALGALASLYWTGIAADSTWFGESS
jgi:hypothetical protein